jgi:quinol monooxygenase YgiN
MDQVVIIAKITAKESQESFIKDELMKLIPPTKEEEGCVSYSLNQHAIDPTNFFFVEKWKSKELWQKHMDSDHIQNFKAASDGKLENFDVFEMNQLNKNS